MIVSTMAGAILASGKALLSKSLLATTSLAKRVKLSVPIRSMAYVTEERGSPNTLDYRIFISEYNTIFI